MKWRQLERQLIEDTAQNIDKPVPDWAEQLPQVIAHVLDIQLSKRAVNVSLALDSWAWNQLTQAAKRLAKGEPVAYVLGSADFGGMTFNVTPDVLIPRHDSEVLVEICYNKAVDLIEQGCASIRIMDLGTGSGCLLITLIHRLQTYVQDTKKDLLIECVGVDISESALCVARSNSLKLLGSEKSTEGTIRWSFIQSDGPPLDARYDIIMTNPPYIRTDEMEGLDASVYRYEPHLALHGGVYGDELIRHVLKHAPTLMVHGGIIASEHGFEQFEYMKKLATEYPGIECIMQERDLADRPRVTVWQYFEE